MDDTAAAARIITSAASTSTAASNAAYANEWYDGNTDAMVTYGWHAEHAQAPDAECPTGSTYDAGHTASGWSADASKFAGTSLCDSTSYGTWTASGTCASCSAATGNWNVSSAATGIGAGRSTTTSASTNAGTYASGSASTDPCGTADNCPIAFTGTRSTEVGGKEILETYW